MRKIYTFIFTALLLTSCLEREPLNGPSLESYPYPSNEEEALSGVLASYKAIANMSLQYCPYFRIIDNMTDIGCMRNVDTYYNMFLNSTATSEAGLAKYLYERIYKNVGRVHLVLDKLDGLKESFNDEETYYQLKAELLCLRAFNYDLGCQHYGDIPFVEHSLSIKDCATPRMPREQVIERILSDMDDELLDHLPVVWDYKLWGHSRIGRAAAYTLKARICLNWGMYEDAAKYSAKAIELSEGKYSLTELDTKAYPTHFSGEPSAANLFGFEGEKSSKEWMWGMQYDILAAANTHSAAYTMSPRTHNGAAYLGPTQALMDTFQDNKGYAITDPLSVYNPSKPWENRDPRLDLYCLRSGSRFLGVEFSVSAADPKVMDYNKEEERDNNDVTGNKSEFGPNKTKGPGGYLWRKFADPAYYGKIVNADYKDELDHCVMRYAELLLIDAEANIEWEGGDLARAENMINKVRARVKMPEVKAGGDRAKLRSALRYERKVELCCEGFRWFDLRRWKDKDGKALAEKALNGVIWATGYSTDKNKNNYISRAKPIIDEDWIVKYEGTSVWSGSFNLRRMSTEMKYDPAKDVLWPIPYDEMVTNTAITTNNPGY